MEGNAAMQWQNRERYSGGRPWALLLSKEGGQTVIGQQGECRIRSCRRSPAGFGQVEEYSKPFSFMSNDGGLEGEYKF